MAAGDGAVYNTFKRLVMAGDHDLTADDIKVCLVNGYTPDVDLDAAYANIIGFEVSGSGYTAGGVLITGKTVVTDVVNDKSIFDAEDAEWTNLSAGSVSHAVMYNDTLASKPLIAYWEVTAASLGADYILQWGSSGILTLA